MALCRSAVDVFPNSFDETLFAHVAGDHISAKIGQIIAVGEIYVIAVEVEEVFHRREAAALVPL